MSDTTTDAGTTAPKTGVPSLEEMQHWTRILGQAQQMMLEHGIAAMQPPEASPIPAIPGLTDAATIRRTQDFWRDSGNLWRRLIDPVSFEPAPERPEHATDRRFKDPRWHDNPVFDWIRRSYFLFSDQLLSGVDAITDGSGGLEPKQKEQLRFAARGFVDAMSPSNFPTTNPAVLDKTIETGGENLIKGLQNMLADISRGQMTQSDTNAFEIGRNIATTPGKVVHRTPLYELLQYTPTTPDVMRTPIVIYPPWINRFYILDLNPEKSFIRWAVDQGITVFMVSWRSADASMKDVVWDDYVAAQINAIDTIREGLDVPDVHAVGYCVAGTTLAATLSLLAERGQAATVRSATFLTTQVDFTEAGDLLHFVDDEQLAMFKALTPDGFLDGRYMAATFNLLRGRDLIWNYVTSNYLLGQDYMPFDMLHWNGDTTNLPAKWHLSYLTDLYRDNLLARPGALSVCGTPIDLGRIATPAYIQAGREDHIAPPESVWKLRSHLAGPVRFVLAGSGHIAGVVNPPASGKYQFWVNAEPGDTLEDFIAGAKETRGSWWPDWVEWLRQQDPESVQADGARIPGEGRLSALEDAPGTYVRKR